MAKDNPCWDGYEMVGWKEKNGKRVPNCVPVKNGKPKPMRRRRGMNELVDKYLGCGGCREKVEESEYQGKKVKLNDPFRLPSGSNKKFGVYVKNDKGNVVKVTFGDPNMEIKRDDPERRKAFRARHNCDDPGPKWKARYWSCYQWRGSAKVDN